jgi:Ca2+-binding EF-hand superfamily protein
MRRTILRAFHGGRQAATATNQHNFNQDDEFRFKPFLAILGAIGAGTIIGKYTMETAKQKKKSAEESNESSFSINLQKRFNKYATINIYGEGDDELRMTTFDLFRSILNRSDLSDEVLMKLVPENIEWFTENGKNIEIGVSEPSFSITEYILLTNMLVSNKTKFKLAFDMIDTERNDKISRKEFNVMKNMFRRNIKCADHEKSANGTFLDTFFFNNDDNNAINFQQFQNFAIDFQNSVLKLEYAILAGQSPETEGVSRQDFAKLILDQTSLKEDAKRERLTRLEKPDSSITEKDFRTFFVLMHNVSDLKAIMKYYALAGEDIGLAQMKRATELATLDEPDPTEAVIHILFKMFDANGDDTLDYHEFVSLLRDQIKFKYVSF